jgi:hypothetical protein
VKILVRCDADDRQLLDDHMREVRLRLSTVRLDYRRTSRTNYAKRKRVTVARIVKYAGQMKNDGDRRDRSSSNAPARQLARMNAFYVVAVLAACGGGNTDNTDYASCFAQGSAGAQACAQCTQSSCPSQVSAFEGACQAYLACECPNGSPGSGSVGSDSCETEIGSGSCLSDIFNLSDCEHTTCVAQCGSASD